MKKLQTSTFGIKYVLLHERATRKQYSHNADINPKLHPVEGNGTHKRYVLCYTTHNKQLRPVNPPEVYNMI